MIISMQLISEMKKELDSKFGIYLHIRDACGGQSFWFETMPDKQAIEWIEEYAAKLGGKVSFFDEGKQFTVI